MCIRDRISQAELDYSRAEMDFTARKYIMLLNQQPVKLETSPIWKKESGLLLIPLRFIAEMNRFSVTWDASANQATFLSLIHISEPTRPY